MPGAVQHQYSRSTRASWTLRGLYRSVCGVTAMMPAGVGLLRLRAVSAAENNVKTCLLRGFQKRTRYVCIMSHHQPKTYPLTMLGNNQYYCEKYSYNDGYGLLSCVTLWLKRDKPSNPPSSTDAILLNTILCAEGTCEHSHDVFCGTTTTVAAVVHSSTKQASSVPTCLSSSFGSHFLTHLRCSALHSIVSEGVMPYELSDPL